METNGPVRTIDELLARARSLPPQVIAVAAAAEDTVIDAITKAAQLGIGRSILVGDEPRIRELARSIGSSLPGAEIIHEPDRLRAAAAAVALAREGHATILLKGDIPSGEFLRACLDRNCGIRRQRLLSHVSAFECLDYGKLLLLTDSGLVIAPTLAEKAVILQNAIAAAAALGIVEPKVAVLAAVEVVNPDMPATVDAAALTMMAERGQITGALVDGPLAFDNAVNLGAARHKHIKSQVAGQADLVLVPDIEAGNAVGKAMIYLGRATMAGVVVGAKVPIALTSRFESARGRLASLAWASLVAAWDQQNVAG